MLPRAEFLFLTCQVGAEGAAKAEMARRWPDFRFAYSRPGFLTFKLPQENCLGDDFDLDSVFARAYAFSLGKSVGDAPEELARRAWQLVGELPAQRWHVWPRDLRAAGNHGFEPGESDASRAAREALIRSAPTPDSSALAAALAEASPGELVVDCVVVGPGEWWLGYHRARPGPSCLPGGLADLSLPADAASRAWLKMEEALGWSGLPVAAGDACVEIGCAPGGSCQALLARGLKVVGIDPAAVEPIVLAHPNFTHVRKRGAEVRRREFRKTRWLFADMNVAPGYTLDTIEAIVTYPEVQTRGLLLTLKLADWKLAADVPAWLDRIRSWGFGQLAARQLQYGRQEICIAAQRSSTTTKPRGTKGVRRSTNKRRTLGKPRRLTGFSD